MAPFDSNPARWTRGIAVVAVGLLAIVETAAGQSAADQPRPIPYPMKTSVQFDAAVQAGSRDSPAGEPV